MDKKKTGELVGYARVSTVEQNLDMQIDALRRAGVTSHLYVEKVSASARRRPQFDFMLEALRPGDTVVVWRLDRLGRDVRKIHATIDKIREAGASIKSLTEQIDTETPFGKFALTLTAAFAQLERDSTVLRTNTGIAVARRNGKRFGQAPKLDFKQRQKCRDWHKKDGLSVREIVGRVVKEFRDADGKRIKNIAHGTVHKYLRSND